MAASNSYAIFAVASDAQQEPAQSHSDHMGLLIHKFWSHKFGPAPSLPMAGLVILIDGAYTSYMRMINAHYSWATG